ncbi:MAG TPA: hypothetical protein VK850_14405 [Candidatus Binatia bacterium]|nr:hypothetical protein [Candidatus Binatia bacterium]
MSRNAKIFALFSFLRRGGVALAGTAFVSISAASGGPNVKLPPAPTNRVVIVENANATDAFQPRLDIVRQMVDQGVAKLLTVTNVTDGWRQLLKPQDVIGLKVYCAPGRNCGTRPALVAAVIESLSAAGFSASNIVVWDKHRSELRRAGFSIWRHVTAWGSRAQRTRGGIRRIITKRHWSGIFCMAIWNLAARMKAQAESHFSRS